MKLKTISVALLQVWFQHSWISKNQSSFPMQDEYPQYLKLQAPCGSYNLVITVNLSTNTNSKTNKKSIQPAAPANSDGNLKKKKKYAFILVFLSVQLKSFYWPAEMKVTIKKNTQTSPLTTVQPTGVGTPPITLPAIPTAGRHMVHWSKERTWKLQHYLPMCGFLVHSENGIWFDGGSGHYWQVARGGGGVLSP